MRAICGKCKTEQDLVKRKITDRIFTYWCPSCHDQIAPSAVIPKDGLNTKNNGLMSKICSESTETPNKTKITEFNRNMTQSERDYYGEEFNGSR